MAKLDLFTKIIASLLVLTVVFTAIPNAVYALTTLDSNNPTSGDIYKDFGIFFKAIGK